MIDALDDLVHNAKRVPMSDQVRLDAQEVYRLLDHMRASLPAEVNLARAIVREAPDTLTRAREALDQPPSTPVRPARPLPPAPTDVDVDSPDKVLGLVDALDDMASQAKRVPLSDDVRINREHLYELIDGMRAGMPQAVKMAHWLLIEIRQGQASEGGAPPSPPPEDGFEPLTGDFGAG